MVIVVEQPDGDTGEPMTRQELAGRFDKLPEPVHLEDTITSVETVVPSGPEFERNPEVDFMLRYAIL